MAGRGDEVAASAMHPTERDLDRGQLPWRRRGRPPSPAPRSRPGTRRGATGARRSGHGPGGVRMPERDRRIRGGRSPRDWRRPPRPGRPPRRKAAAASAGRPASRSWPAMSANRARSSRRPPVEASSRSASAVRRWSRRRRARLVASYGDVTHPAVDEVVADGGPAARDLADDAATRELVDRVDGLLLGPAAGCPDRGQVERATDDGRRRQDLAPPSRRPTRSAREGAPGRRAASAAGRRLAAGERRDDVERQPLGVGARDASISASSTVSRRSRSPGRSRRRRRGRVDRSERLVAPGDRRQVVGRRERRSASRSSRRQARSRRSGRRTSRRAR